MSRERSFLLVEVPAGARVHVVVELPPSPAHGEVIDVEPPPVPTVEAVRSSRERHGYTRRGERTLPNGTPLRLLPRRAA